MGCQSWAPVITIAQDPTVGSFQDFFRHLQIVDIGGNQADPGNHARPADAQMRTQPKKGLSSHLIMSKSGPARDQFGAIGSRKATDGYRKTIDQRYGWIVVDVLQHCLPQMVFGDPQVCRWIAYSGASSRVGHQQVTVRHFSDGLLYHFIECSPYPKSFNNLYAVINQTKMAFSFLSLTFTILKTPESQHTLFQQPQSLVPHSEIICLNSPRPGPAQYPPHR